MITEEELANAARGIFIMNKELEMTRKALYEVVISSPPNRNTGNILLKLAKDKQELLNEFSEK